MKKITIVVLFLVLMSGVVYAHSLDTGPITFDAGIPVLYFNHLDLAQSLGEFAISNTVSAVRNFPIKILSNARAGFEIDFLLNVVPDVLGIGFNTAVLMSFGFHPNVVSSKMAILIDVPIRASVRVGLGDVGYVQIHSGFYLQNIVEAIDDSSFSLFRYIDIGLRFKIGSFALTAGYLIEVVPPPSGSNLTPNPELPFYAGLYIPIT